MNSFTIPIRRAQRLNEVAVAFSLDGFKFLSTQKNELTRNEFNELLDMSKWHVRTLVLCNTNLSNIDLSDLDINFINFINVDLTNAKLNRSSLKCVSFENSFMFKSEFNNSIWQHVIVSKSNMSHASMEGIKLNDVQFRGGTNLFGIKTDIDGASQLLRCDRNGIIHQDITVVGSNLKIIR